VARSREGGVVVAVADPRPVELLLMLGPLLTMNRRGGGGRCHSDIDPTSQPLLYTPWRRGGVGGGVVSRGAKVSHVLIVELLSFILLIYHS
jgi:hypothetical protein